MIQIIKIPAINGLGNTIGTLKAPDLIEETGIKLNINNSNLEEQQKAIYSEALKYLKKGKTIFLGGDHSITYSTAKAFYKLNKNAFFLIFDAHPDLMSPMENPTHEEWLRAFIEKTKINPESIILLGIRKKSANIDDREIDYAIKNKIKMIYPEDFEKNKEELIKKCNNKDLYVSFDIDALDNSLANATFYAEKDGLKLDVLDFLKKLNIKALDIVEINPDIADPSKTIKIAKDIISTLKANN